MSGTETRVEALEGELDSFDRCERQSALDELIKLVQAGRLELPTPGDRVNVHVHSFHSYNALGYSPSHIVWRARQEGLAVVGLVDFDILDGVDEFFEAGGKLGLGLVAGIETRAYIPELATREINSPGEPGVTYHMGSGFVQSAIDNPAARQFAQRLRRNAQQRNMDMVHRVNSYLDPVRVDYQTDVLPLSPSGTPTERHLCYAYERKAREVLPNREDQLAWWAGRLEQKPEAMEAKAGKELIEAESTVVPEPPVGIELGPKTAPVKPAGEQK